MAGRWSDCSWLYRVGSQGTPAHMMLGLVDYQNRRSIMWLANFGARLRNIIVKPISFCVDGPVGDVGCIWTSRRFWDACHWHAPVASAKARHSMAELMLARNL